MATLIIGLGNPGGEYARTRHNIGWACLDELERRGKFGKERREGQARVAEGSLEGFDVVVARPQTYMNESGRAGRQLTDTFGVLPDDVIVVHDDIDLKIGRINVKRGGSSGGQKGVASLIDSWRTPNFVRVRIGVGRPGDKADVVDYVLDKFHPDEREPIEKAVRRAVDAVVMLIREGLEPTQAAFNGKSEQ